MKKIRVIYLKNEENYIGKDGNLLYRFSKDMSYFRGVTQENTIVMGMKTFLEINRKLPRRKMIVIADMSRPFEKVKDIVYVSSLEEAYEEYLKDTFGKFFVVGGAKIYNELMKNYEEDVVEIHETVVADTKIGDAQLDFDIDESSYNVVTHTYYDQQLNEVDNKLYDFSIKLLLK